MNQGQSKNLKAIKVKKSVFEWYLENGDLSNSKHFDWIKLKSQKTLHTNDINDFAKEKPSNMNKK